MSRIPDEDKEFSPYAQKPESLDSYLNGIIAHSFLVDDVLKRLFYSLSDMETILELDVELTASTFRRFQELLESEYWELLDQVKALREQHDLQQD